jgi:energy-converting hydrogenase Eha subunit B
MPRWQTNGEDGAMTMHYGYGGFGFLGGLIFGALLVMPFWRICIKAGYAGALSLLVLVPIVNIVFVYFLAFSDWPSQQHGSVSS